jgi:putative transposase
MKRGRFTEEQIIGVLKQHEADAEYLSSRGISGERGDDLHQEIEVRGMQVSEAQNLKGLEDENRRLKQLVADLSLDKEVLKAVIQKNGRSFRHEEGRGVHPRTVPCE